MKIVKCLKILTLFAILLFVVSPVFAVTNTPTPTDNDEEKVIEKLKQIETLKEKIATKVAEIRENEKGGLIGTVKKIEDTTITLATRKEEKSINYSEDTLFYSVSNNKKTETSADKLKEDDFISVLGYFDESKDTLSAKYIYIQDPYVRTTGKIADIDKKNYTITVKGKQGDSIVDIETYTKSVIYTQEKGSLKIGFSKLKPPDTVYIWGIPNEKQENRLSAERIIVIPNTQPTSTPSPTDTTTPTPEATE